MSASHFANVIDAAFGHALTPPFNPYADSISYLLASYLIPYVGLTGYVGAAEKLQSAPAKKVCNNPSPIFVLHSSAVYLQ